MTTASGSRDRPASVQPGPELTLMVRRALAHLYDYAYLQSHPLALMLDVDRALDQVTRAQKLRRVLLECVEALRPQGQGGESPSEAMRAHAILTFRYVDGLPIGEIASRLALSRRQAYREHEKGLEATASVLADRLRREPREPAAPVAGGDADGDRLKVAQAEVDRLRQTVHTEPLPLLEVLGGVIELLAPVGAQVGVKIEVQTAGPGPAIMANRVMLRQALVNVFSYALNGIVRGNLTVTLRRCQGDVCIDIEENRPAGQPCPNLSPAPTAGNVGLAVSQALAEAQGGRLELCPAPGSWRARMTLPASGQRTILVVDDNADMVALLERYLAGHAIAVVGAMEGQQALRLAAELQPQLITLDVMMPDHDGWEILQKLKSSPDTQSIPVVICSVLNEPRLAQAMGASDYITKPVRQDALLAVLRRWLGTLSTAARPGATPPAAPAGSR
jgi:CheY-like chemotaxis protein/signal transduction histidine kinase